jgi:hypothetical protein
MPASHSEPATGGGNSTALNSIAPIVPKPYPRRQ